MNTRRVVVRWTVDYVVEVPSDWTPEQIWFHRNCGSWCANEALREVGADRTERLRALGYDDDCLCGQSVFEFVREATIRDEIADGFAEDTK